MTLPIYVDAYSGYRANERPQRFTLDDEIDEATIKRAEQKIESCEFCNAEGAEIPFDWVLDRVCGRSGSNTDYFLVQPAKCPNCRQKVTEKTLVEPV